MSNEPNIWDYGYGTTPQAWTTKGDSTELEAIGDGLHVTLTQGVGLMQQHCAAAIPRAVVMELVRRAGWTLVDEPASTEDK